MRWILTLALVGAVTCGGEKKAPSCEETPCFRPNECVNACGGPLVYTGCCACPKGSFDRTQCASDAARD